MADDVEQEGQPSRWSHLLGEFTSLEDVAQPIKISARIRYTSLAVSSKYLAIGANSGAIYVFQKDGWRYLQMLPGDNAGAVVQMAFSPDENVLGYATSEGLVMVIALRIAQRLKPDKLRSTHDHKGANVTTVHWNASGDRLYVGDNLGQVTVIKVPTSKVRHVFSMSSETIMRLSSQVVQVDVCEDKILVSTLACTFMGNTSKQQFSRIGTKPRDGLYGSCFYHGVGMETPVVYCARPGSRMWEVDYDGNVLNTHQFKKLLDTPALPIISTLDDSADYSCELISSTGPQAINFPKLLLCGDKYLLTWTEKAIYIFHPAEARVLLWTSDLEGLQDIQVDRSDLYLLFADNTVRKLSLLPIPKVVQRLMVQKKWQLAGSICLHFKSALIPATARKHVSDSMLQDLKEHLNNLNLTDIVSGLDNLLDDLEFNQVHSSGSSRDSRSSSVTSFERLNSGIYVIRRRTESESLVEKQAADKNLITSHDAADTKSVNGDVAVTSGSQAITDSPDTANDVEKDAMPSDKVESVEDGHLSIVTDQDKDEAIDSLSFVLSEEGSAPVEDNSLKRVPSTESLQSLASLSSSELMFGPPTIDPEPIYSKTGGRVKQRGKKMRSAKIISLDEDTMEKKASSNFRRSQSTTVLEKKRSKPLLKTSSSMDAMSENAVEETPQEIESSATMNPATDNTVSPSISDIGDSPSEPIVIKISDSPSQSSLLSSVENDGDERCVSSQGSAGESSQQSTADSSPRFKFLAVKDRISSKVSTTAKSLVQTIKDKRNQLTRKEGASPVTEDAKFSGMAEFVNTEEVEPSTNSFKHDKLPLKLNFPKVDTSRLEEITHVTRSKMADPTVLYNPTEARVVLTEWVQVLHNTLDTMHSAVMEEKKQGHFNKKAQKSDLDLRSDAAVPVVDFSEEDSSALLTSGEESGYNSVAPSGDKADDALSVTSIEDAADIIDRDTGKMISVIDSDSNDNISQTTDTKGQILALETAHSFPEKQDMEIFGDSDRELDTVNLNNILVENNISSGIDRSLNGTCAIDHEKFSRRDSQEVELPEVNSNSNNSSCHSSDLSDIPHKDGPKFDSVGLDLYSPNQSNLPACDKMTSSADDGPNGSVEIEGCMENEFTLDSLCKGCHFRETMYLSDPFDLDCDTHFQVAELAMLCFEFKCHGDILHFFETCDKCDSCMKLLHNYNLNGELDLEREKTNATSVNATEVAKDGHCSDCIPLFNSKMHCSHVLPKEIQDREHWSVRIGETTKLCSNCGKFFNPGQLTPLEATFYFPRNELSSHTASCLDAFSVNSCASSIKADLPEEDFRLGFLLQYYFHLFDGQLDQVRDVIHKSTGSRWWRWKSLLACQHELGQSDLVSEKVMQDDVEGAFDLLRSGLPQEKKAVLAHLQSLYVLTPLKTLEFCYENRRQIFAFEVLYMCLEFSKGKHAAHISFYAGKFLNSVEAETRLLDLCSDPEVWLVCLESLLQNAYSKLQSTLLHCECGFPWPGSHLHHWATQPQLDSLLNMSGDYTPLALQLTNKYGYWSGFLKLPQHSTDEQRAAVVLQLGDITLLESDSDMGFPPKGEEEWTVILKLKEKQYYGADIGTKSTCSYHHFCLNCGKNLYENIDNKNDNSYSNSSVELENVDSSQKDELLSSHSKNYPCQDLLPWVTWESLARLLVESTGVTRALEMLTSIHVPDGVLSSEFYGNCVAATILESEQRAVVQDLLEKIDTYLWSARPAALPPRLHMAVEEEKNMKKNDLSTESSLDKLVSSLTSSSHLCGTLEDPECHWGVNTDASGCCGVCGLLLGDMVSTMQPGAVFFQCGHGYHHACLPEQVCIQCIIW